MQRKNYSLKSIPSRSGIAMIMAIFVLILISTILALSLRMSTQTTKRTTELFLYEQAEIIAYNAAEYALMRIGTTPFVNGITGPCTPLNLDFKQDTFYDVSIDVQYISNDNSCGALEYVNTGSENDNTAIIDVSVTVDDTSLTPERIRYYKRYIQKL